MRVSPACHASLMPVIMMMSSSPHFGTQSGKCESTPHAARTRTIIDYPWRALAKGELAATTQAAALTARRAHCEQRAHCSPRSLLAALTARRAACMTAHGAHCSPGGMPYNSGWKPQSSGKKPHRHQNPCRYHHHDCHFKPLLAHHGLLASNGGGPKRLNTLPSHTTSSPKSTVPNASAFS